MWGNINELTRIQSNEKKSQEQKIRRQEREEVATDFASEAGSILMAYVLFSKIETFDQLPTPINFILFGIFLQFINLIRRNFNVATDELELLRLQAKAWLSNEAIDYYCAGKELFRAGKLESALREFHHTKENKSLNFLTHSSIIDVANKFLKMGKYNRAYEILYPYIKDEPSDQEKTWKEIAIRMLTQPAERCFAMADYFSKQSDHEKARNLLVLMPEKKRLYGMYSSNSSKDYYIAQLKAARISMKIAEGLSDEERISDKAKIFEKAKQHCKVALIHTSTQKKAQKLLVYTIDPALKVIKKYFQQELKTARSLMNEAKSIECLIHKESILLQAREYCSEALIHDSTKVKAKELDETIKERLLATCCTEMEDYQVHHSCFTL